MKTPRIILCLTVVLCGISNAFAEARFFKANSVRISYLWQYSFYDPIFQEGQQGSKDEWHQAEMWIGNDTIIDGCSCVSLWNKDIDSTAICIGFIREDDEGLVWRYYITSPFVYPPDDGKYQWILDDFEIRNKWVFLYDFSNPDWKKGAEIKTWPLSLESGYVVRTIDDVSYLNLENGDRVAVYNLYHIIYGIGTTHRLFEGNIVQINSEMISHVLEYWRDGELLIKNDYPTSIDRPIKKSTSESYDLIGRPVDGTQKGILIRNGKKVLVK